MAEIRSFLSPRHHVGVVCISGGGEYTAILQKQPRVSEQYLWTGWTVASRIKEKRLKSYFKRTIAYYHRETGDCAEALRWAEDALDILNGLGCRRTSARCKP